jgi:type II secretory pathway component GspD/PulD (secretin)
MLSRVALALLSINSAAVADNTVMEVIPLHNRPAAEIQVLLSPLLEANDRVVDNGAGLIVKTTPERLESLENIIKQLDTPVANLVVTVFQHSDKTAAELNAEAALAGSGQIIMHGMNADTRDVNNSRDAQVLRTLDGQPAYIKTGKLTPTQNSSQYGSYNGGISASSNTQILETSTGFAVTPRLSGQRVLIDIEPWTDQTDQNAGVNSQTMHTTLSAELGEWVEIAGSDNTGLQNKASIDSINQLIIKGSNIRLLIKVERMN